MRILPEPYEAVRRDAGLGDLATAAAILGALLLPGFLGVAETVAFWRIGELDVPAWRALPLQLPQWLVFALATPLILWLGERVPLRRDGWRLALPLHLVFALTVGVAYAATAAGASVLFSPFESSRSYGTQLVGWYLSGLPVMILTYFAIQVTARAAYWFHRTRSAEVHRAQLEARLAGARLDALRMQLHPHFLFNSLNALSVLVRDHDWEAAERSVHLLAGLLRESLSTDRGDVVPLAEELDFTLRYLEMERLRFPDRLTVTTDVEAATEALPVPVRILQPLVENALRHGIAPAAEGGEIHVAAHCAEGVLTLVVRDDGVGLAARALEPTSRGVGLENVRERLRVLYGDRAACAVSANAGRGVRAEVTLPVSDGERVDPGPRQVS